METGEGGDIVIPGSPLDITQRMYIRYGDIARRAKMLDRLFTLLFILVPATILVNNVLATIIATGLFLAVTFIVYPIVVPNHARFVKEFIDNAKQVSNDEEREAFTRWGESRINKDWLN